MWKFHFTLYTSQSFGKCLSFPTSPTALKMAIPSVHVLHSYRPPNASYIAKRASSPRVLLGFRSSVDFNLCSLRSFFVSSSARSRAWAVVRDKGEKTEDYPPVADSVDDNQVTLSFPLFQGFLFLFFNELYTLKFPILDYIFLVGDY